MLQLTAKTAVAASTAGTLMQGRLSTQRAGVLKQWPSSYLRPPRASRSMRCCRPSAVAETERTPDSAPPLVDLPRPALSSTPSQEPAGPSGRPPSPNPSLGPSPGPSLLKILYKRTLKRLSSLPLAIAELFVIAGLSAVGTVIEQNKSYEYYIQNYPDGPDRVLGFLSWDLLLFLQLDHIFTSSYFLALMALLAASLAACTSTRQWPMVRVARRWRFASSLERLYKEGNAEVLPSADIRDFGRILADKGYQIFLKDGSLYGFKGLAGRIGPIGVHAAMLAVMAGVAYGGLFGYKGAAMIPQGSDLLLASALRPASPVASPPAGAEGVLHVNSFGIDYREDGSERQFYTDLSIKDAEGREVQRATISVNKPLRHVGVTVYQTDWAMAALTLRARGSPLQPPKDAPFNLPMASLEGRPGVSGRLWATFVPSEAPTAAGAAPRGVSILARDLQSVALYDSTGKFAGVRRLGSGKPIVVEGLEILVDDIIGSSGVELKVDPGVPFVYAGFGGLMITTLVSYLSHSQVWAVQAGRDLHVAGRTNRATVAFQAELSEMLDRVPEGDS